MSGQPSSIWAPKRLKSKGQSLIIYSSIVFRFSPSWVVWVVFKKKLIVPLPELNPLLVDLATCIPAESEGSFSLLLNEEKLGTRRLHEGSLSLLIELLYAVQIKMLKYYSNPFSVLLGSKL